MKTPVSMLYDHRPIRLVNDDIGGQNLVGVGMHGVTEIVCYSEPCEVGVAPFLAIYKGEEIIARLAVGRGMTIYYDETKERLTP